MNNKCNETGNIITEVGCLLPVVIVIVVGIIGLLSGNTSVLDLYNWMGSVAQTIGHLLGM